MDRTGTTSQGASAAGTFDVPAEGMLPVRVEEHSGIVRPRRSWLGVGARIVRDLVVAVSFMTLVPIAMVAFKGDNTWGHGNFGNNTRAKLALSRTYRPLALPKDPSITPMQAGLAFNALQPWPDAARIFPMLEPTSRPAHNWEKATLTSDMFVNGTMNVGFHGPSSAVILERAKNLSAQETAYLHTLATAPVWKEFDLVARAPAVDIIGGSFKLPFPENASVEDMPVSAKTTRELAYASVSRAAYHLSIGQRDSAETILRSIVSFGFVMIDNGHTAMDELMGNVIVAIGRDALGRFFVLTNDPRAAQPNLAPPAKVTSAGTERLPMDEMRRFLIAETQNPDEALGIRFEAARLLSAASCTNVKELMFGNGSDVTAALDKANTDLARYASERALVGLLSRPSSPQLRPGQMMYNPIGALAISSATVAGTVLRNPRLAACTRIVAEYYGGPW